MPTIFVEAKPVLFGAINTGADHTYLVYRSDLGRDYVIGGRAEDPNIIVDGPFEIETNVPIEKSDDARGGLTPQERNAQELSFEDLSADAAWSLMVRYAREIDAADLRYFVTGTNSNALVGALTEAAGVLPGLVPPETGSSLGAVGFDSASDILSQIPAPADGIIRGTSGQDIIERGEVHGETFRLFAGNDRVHGGWGDDTIKAGAGRDQIEGGRGADRLFGFTGRDTLDGGRGQDGLFGGAQADILTGGAGADVLVGGKGADSFRFAGDAFGRDTIRDFRTTGPQNQQDSLHFSASSIDSFDSFIAASRQVERGVVVTPAEASKGRILLEGVVLEDLSAQHIEIA